MERRPTQSDVAKAAGVHRATVSLTFKNHPSIPESTKQRVRECAKKVGYSPDPMLSALAAYRSRCQPKAFQGTLAWLSNDLPDGGTWRTVTAYRDYYEGASSRARSHGFKLEEFDLSEYATAKRRLASIFRSRNIPGILLPPQLRPNVDIDFAWHEFSAVAFGHSLNKPHLHRVTAAQFRSTVETMRQIKLLGYKRIGFYFGAKHDEQTDHNYLAGYLVESYEDGRNSIVPPLLVPEPQAEVFLQWYEKYRPDAIVSGYKDILGLLKSLGIRVPADLGVASPLLERDVMERKPSLAGVYEDSIHIGEVATDLLVAMIQRGERGIPAEPQRVLVEGTWNLGDTLRRMPDAKPSPPPDKSGRREKRR